MLSICWHSFFFFFIYNLGLKLQSRGSQGEQQLDKCLQLHKRQHYKKPIVRVKGQSPDSIPVGKDGSVLRIEAKAGYLTALMFARCINT